MYRAEHVLIGPANHAHARIVFGKKQCTAMVLRVSSPMPQRGSRKGETFGAGFSEPHDKDLCGLGNANQHNRCWADSPVNLVKNSQQKSDHESLDVELYSGSMDLLCDDVVYHGKTRIVIEFGETTRLIARCDLSNASHACIELSRKLSLRIGDHGQVDASHVHSEEAHSSSTRDVKATFRLSSRGIRLYPNKRKKLFSLDISVFNFHGFSVSGLYTETDKWKISFEQIEEPSQGSKSLRRASKYSLSHLVTVTRRDGKLFSLSEAEEFLSTFRTLLAFANGMPTFAGLCIGRSRNGDVLLREWSAPASMAMRARFSWLDESLGSSLVEFIPAFYRLAESGSLGKACSEAVYWYLQSNVGGASHGIDGGLILSHAALHRLSLSYLGRNSKKSAADDIRDAATKLKIPVFIPNELAASHTAKRKKAWKDTPDAINKMRNDLIHPKPYLAISRRKVVPETWLLAQWYVELFVLALSGHTGRYSRRTRRGMWNGETEYVPWARRSTMRPTR